MIRRHGAGLAAIALVALAAAATAAPQYRTYVNERFGTTADVPADWTADPPPENGDGLRFRSPDGHASIAVYGHLNVADTVEDAMTEYEAPGRDETITYRHRERRAVVVSGTRGDTIFYSRHVLSCGDEIWNSVHLEYPAAEKAAFDALVTHVARSLRPGPSWQVSRCK
jgi:serine/threonine-protein kinase